MSPFSNANYLKALGLTSLGMKEKGAAGVNALMGAVPRAPLADPSSMLVTPQQEQEAAYMAQVLANAPVPSAAAKANLEALKAGTNLRPNGAGGPVGGFNVPIRGGGPAFPDASPNWDMPAYNPNATTAVLGATNPYTPTNSYYQTPQAYDNWNKLASSWNMGPVGGFQNPMEYDPEIASDQYSEGMGPIQDIAGEPMYPDDQYAQQWQDFYDMGGI